MFLREIEARLKFQRQEYMHRLLENKQSLIKGLEDSKNIYENAYVQLVAIAAAQGKLPLITSELSHVRNELNKIDNLLVEHKAKLEIMKHDVAQRFSDNEQKVTRSYS